MGFEFIKKLPTPDEIRIPVLGIRGYFYGMLLSQLVLTLLHFIYLNRLERV